MKSKLFPIILLSMLVLTGCHKDKMMDFSITARIEQPTNADGSKVYLDDERWVYWELGDQISIGSDICPCDGTSEYTARLVNVSTLGGVVQEDYGYFNGVFITTMGAGSSYFLGLHPMDSRNRIIGQGEDSKNFTSQIYLPDTQGYRNDYTFDLQVYPMVAWYGGVWDAAEHAFNLDFHALGGIVRLNLFNNSGQNKNLQSIEITSRDGKQLKGLFDVNDYKIEDPYLSPADNVAANQKVVLYCGDGGLTFGANNLYTFYLVLPALGGRGVTTDYQLEMKVKASDDSYIIKNFTVPVRRTGMTNMQAMGVTGWATGSGNGTGDPGLSGCGTADRPFKVYSIDDLLYLRDCYNANGAADPRYIDGQQITGETYISIMRSDIELTTGNWTVGIRNFKGHINSISATSNPGITNSGHNVPLFESIGEDGVVENITLKSAVTFNISNETGVSPFCASNAGTIRDCAVTSIPGNPKFTLSIFSPMAGICVTNTGTIEGCRCEGKMEVQSDRNFAGICLHNQSGGMITGCQAASLNVRATGKASGICYENATGATVKDSYYAANITSSTADWAGICYDNSGTVEHCYSSSTGNIYTTSNVGGIVGINRSAGKVDYCWAACQMRGDTVGGVVAKMIGGQVINSFNQNTAMITVTNATSIAGGLVAYMTAGSIDNSYINDMFLMGLNTSATLGGIVGKTSGGSIDNCYDYEDLHMFYGISSGTTAYINCHIVDGSQAGITHCGNAAADFNNLYTELQAVATAAATYYDWMQTTTGTPPILEPYTISKK